MQIQITQNKTDHFLHIPQTEDKPRLRFDSSGVCVFPVKVAVNIIRTKITPELNYFI